MAALRGACAAWLDLAATDPAVGRMPLALREHRARVQELRATMNA